MRHHHVKGATTVEFALGLLIFLMLLLGIVDFSIFPHLNHELMPGNTLAAAEQWAADIEGPSYAIDDQTAISVSGDTLQVISEGQWKQLWPHP